jgi:adenosylcobinamide-GDP ribazoletransferase
VRVRFVEGDLQRAAGFFPAVGALVAWVGVAVRWGLGAWVGDGPATVLALAAMAATTGALHEDGLADTADGLWGGTTVEERLRIMRDSRIGTYGAVALILLVATKLAVLWPMDVEQFAAAVVPAMVLARGSSLVLMGALPPVPDSLASLAGPPATAGWVVAAVTCAISLAGFGRWAVIPLTVAVLVTTGASIVARRRIGGITGDLLGATNQFVEVSVLLAAAATFAAA